jgi:hypothetical protein
LASREKKPLSEKDRRKSQKFLLAFSRLSIVQNLSLSKSVWRRSRCSLLARFCPSLFTAYFEHRRRRESERVGSFFDRNESIHLPFGMKDDDKEEEIFLSSV